MDMIEQKANVAQYNPTIDVMNIAACVAVVALHVNGGIWGFARNLNWAMMLITECVCYWAVPVFFMITGATLLDYRLRYSTKVFFQKRFTKTGIPFIFWSIVSIFWAVYISHYLPPDVLSNLGSFLDAIVNTKGMSIYWFFPPLFALYLAIPVFSQISEDKRRNTFLYGSAIAFIICSCLPLLLSFLKVSFNMPVIGGAGYCEYLFLGYYITHYNIPKKIRTRMIYPLGAFGLLLRYVGTLVESFHIEAVGGTFSGYERFPCVVFSVAVFVWFWYHDWSFLNSGKKKHFLRVVSGASFGVYLTHFYILRYFVDTLQLDMQSWQWRVWGVPAVYLSSLIITLALKRVPRINKLVP